MAITIATRNSRRTRADPVEGDDVVPINPPSSSDHNEEDRQRDDLPGTDNPADEDLDGEAIEEQRRNVVAREIDNLNREAAGHPVPAEDEDDPAPPPTESESHDSESDDSSDSSFSTDSSSNDSSQDSEESLEESSTSDESDSSEGKSSGKKKRKQKSMRSLNKIISRAKREKAKMKGKATDKLKSQPLMMSKILRPLAKDAGKVDKSASHSKSSRKKTKVTKQNGIRFQSGKPCKSLPPALQPHWNQAMKKLNELVPLTVLNPTFVQKDQIESQKNQMSSSSTKSKRNRGLTPPSEYAMSFGEWLDGITYLRKYLKSTYEFKIISDQLRKHVKHVKEIKSSNECWMVALRYDLLVRSHLFCYRAKGVPMPDAGIYVEKFERLAREKSTRMGEFSFGDTNPYAKGARFEHRDPITGVWEDNYIQKKKAPSASEFKLDSKTGT
ncbi:uncharacterized protein MELLADRAFT_70287 [Melampsora larici-populina 98AG31]|uniref:Uncharacterized protein n=1 Tax=Melampsora larici-populina (strain 98AG31 / pathotype 3-4-7) TaxID=747676 RepID=F4SEC6_MELLP|nr:uncharacterized protein MELLADRAFT_70287 [Melampsora larici-populina 98AG31]EGF96999.1 hypothetical protein MELLADRAFT_70287 [Melampsora larici-populina 98AG31]